MTNSVRIMTYFECVNLYMSGEIQSIKSTPIRQQFYLPSEFFPEIC